MRHEWNDHEPDLPKFWVMREATNAAEEPLRHEILRLAARVQELEAGTGALGREALNLDSIHATCVAALEEENRRLREKLAAYADSAGGAVCSLEETLAALEKENRRLREKWETDPAAFER